MEATDRKKGSNYSPQIKERAIELLKDGELTTREIAAELNVDYHSLRLWARKAGIKKLPGIKPGKTSTFKNRERNEKIYNLHFSQGKTQVEIAEMFGISRQRVQQILESVFKKEGKSYLNRTSLTTRLMDIHSLEEAAIWAENHKEEFNLEKTPNAEVLKAAAQDGRLVAIKKGSVWLTSTHEIKIYLTNFHPGRGGHRRVKL